MRWRLEGAGETLRSPFPWIALTAALALTAAGWVGVERNRYDDARTQFERRTETAVASIRARMLAYEQILRSGAAHMASSANVSRAQWRSFISNLLDAGADHAVVQRLAGHADSNTTAGYDRRDERAKQSAVNRLHMPWTRRYADSGS